MGLNQRIKHEVWPSFNCLKIHAKKFNLLYVLCFRAKFALNLSHQVSVKLNIFLRVWCRCECLRIHCICFQRYISFIITVAFTLGSWILFWLHVFCRILHKCQVSLNFLEVLLELRIIHIKTKEWKTLALQQVYYHLFRITFQPWQGYFKRNKIGLHLF